MSARDRAGHAEPSAPSPWKRLETAFQIRRRAGAEPDARSRVLIHAMNFSPEVIGAGRYTGELAEYLATDGHSVEVVTAPPHYPGWHVRPPYRAWRYRRETRKGVRVLRCPILLHRRGAGIWRLLAPLSFAASAAPAVVWRILCSRPHVVVCIEPTLFSAPAALLAARLVGARAVLHVQDLEVDAAFAVGHLPDGVFRRLADGFERFLLRRFGAVVTISGRMGARLLEKGAHADRLHLVRNWVDTTRIRPVHGRNAFREALGLGKEAVVVLYAGQIGPKQGLRSVLDAARQFAGGGKVHFVVAGDGPVKDQLVRDYGGAQNIHFLPLQPEEKLCELLNLADIHMLPQASGVADLVLPSKLGGMLASRGQLVVAAEPGTELHDILAGHAVLVPPGDADAVADGVRRVLAGAREKNTGLAEALFSKPRNLRAFTSALGLGIGEPSTAIRASAAAPEHVQ